VDGDGTVLVSDGRESELSNYRSAIIGCGNRANGHAEGFQKAEGVELVAVADVDRRCADTFAERYGTPAYYGAAEMLERERPEIVSIVTKAAGRSALACLCAEHRVRGVIAEKPMAITLEEADRMAEACRAAGTLLTVSHQMRYSREFEIGKEALASGEIGEPYFMRAVCYGNLMQQGTHVIDMVRWFAGDAPVAWVMAQADDYDWQERDPGHPAPMWMVGYLGFENGLRVTLEMGPRYVPALETSPGWLNKRVEVLARDGMLDCVVGNYAHVFTPDRARREEVPPDKGWNLATIRFIEDLARVLREGGQHRNHAETSVHSFEVIQALARSAHRGGIVKLPLPRDGSEPLGELLASHAR
jgi:predicted dehydrogenase